MPYLAVRGTNLYYEERGDGTPILLVPPSGANASTWGTVPDELTQRGRVIAYDRRGYGRAGHPNAGHPNAGHPQPTGAVVRTAVTHTADAATLLEAVTAEPAVVVGTSAGATIALDLAVRRPDLVRAVVVHEAPWRALLHPDVSGLGALARMQGLAWRGRHDEAADALLRYVYSYREGGSAWDAFPDAWRQTARANGRQVIADLKATLRSYPRRRDLATLTIPVICTYGSRSAPYMRTVMRGLANSIPRATLRQIDSAAHAVPFDAPVAFAGVIGDAAEASATQSVRAPRSLA